MGEENPGELSLSAQKMGQCLSSSPGAELSRATLAGDFDEVSRICSAWPRAVLHQATFSGRTPLHDAADAGSTVALAILVEALGQATGGDRRACAAYIGHPDSRGRTALLLASRGGHQQCVQLLLEEGASPLPADRRWNTALGEACRGGHASTAETLLSARLPTASGGHVAAAAAVVRDSMGDVRWVDAHNRDRLSSLHLAVLSGSVETGEREVATLSLSTRERSGRTLRRFSRASVAACVLPLTRLLLRCSDRAGREARRRPRFSCPQWVESGASALRGLHAAAPRGPFGVCGNHGSTAAGRVSPPRPGSEEAPQPERNGTRA